MRADAMSDEELPPLDKVIAACKIGHKYLGPDTLDLLAAAWMERQQTEIERLAAEAKSYRDAIEWMRARDDRNGSLPEAYREKIDAALAPPTD